MRVLIMNPPSQPQEMSGVSFIKWLFSTFLDSRVLRIFGLEALGIGYLATSLRQIGVKVDVIDACLLELDIPTCVDLACKDDYDLIGISCIQASITEIWDFARQIREKNYQGKIVLGGDFATLNAEKILDEMAEIDFVIRGDGEEPLIALVQSLGMKQQWEVIPNLVWREGGAIKEGPRTKWNLNRDQCSHPSRDYAEIALAKSKTRTLGILSSSGCGYGFCSFCSPGKVSGNYSSRWCPRCPSGVVAEIVDVWNRLRPDWISFVDTDFIGRSEHGRNRAREILQGCRERGVGAKFIFSCRADEVEYDTFKALKRFGAEQVFVGFESFVDCRLRRFNKGTSAKTNWDAIKILDDLGIHYIPGHIIFDPYVRIDEVMDEIAAYEKMDYYALHKLTKSLCVLPSTHMWETLRNEGLLQGDYKGYEYSIIDDKAQKLRTKLNDVQRKMHPSFIRYYEAHPTWDFSSETRNRIKSGHLGIAKHLCELIEKGAAENEVEDFLKIETDRILSYLGEHVEV